MHSQNMASKKVPFGHDGFADRIAKIRAALGSSGFRGRERRRGVWLRSGRRERVAGQPGHRANIEGNSTRNGPSAP